MSYEGAMLGGYLLPKDQFIPLMTELIEQNKDTIINSLNQTLNFIAQGNVKLAYNSWSIFQTEVLKNPTTSLLAILNFYSSENQTWTFVDDEENAISNKAGALNIQKIEQGLKREYNSEILTKHMSNLFSDVYSNMENDEINYLYGLKKSEMLKQLNQAKHDDGVYIYKNIIYGNVFGKYLNGKVADAYLNHLGATHWEFLNNFSKTGVLTDGEHLTRASIKAEERAIHNLNFVHLLMASNNKTAWYTGGDLIITDAKGQVVANIQLKTSGKEGAWIGNIRTATLEKEIIKVKEALGLDCRNAAETFYNMLVTSSVMSELNVAIQKEAKNLAREALGLTK